MRQRPDVSKIRAHFMNALFFKDTARVSFLRKANTCG